jgi:hypothetical protein
MVENSRNVVIDVTIADSVHHPSVKQPPFAA